MLDLTIAIPVKDEEKNLPGCLEAIGKDLAKKVVVIDSSSSDATPEIVKNAGADYVNFLWDGKFPKKRNWFLRNHSPETKWVLFLDADEFLTPKFKIELKNSLNEESRFEGFWLNYNIYFLGKPLKGGYPLKKLALFKVGAGEYERIDEEKWSSMDMEIHEHPILSGEVGEIKARIDHRDLRGIDSYMHKHNEYAAWEAARYTKIRHHSTEWKNYTWKQRLKYRLMRTIWLAPVFFLGSFFLMGGFRDGKRGFAFAILKMSYFAQIYSRIKEIEAK